jgi:hypothetical protein
MNSLKKISFCVLLFLFSCPKKIEGSGLKVKFKNATGFDIKNLKIANQSIGFLKSMESTKYLKFKKFGFDSGYPDETCSGLIDNIEIKSYNELFICGTEKKSIHKGIFEMEIILTKVDGISYLRLNLKH